MRSGSSAIDAITGTGESCGPSLANPDGVNARAERTLHVRLKPVADVHDAVGFGPGDGESAFEEEAVGFLDADVGADHLGSEESFQIKQGEQSSKPAFPIGGGNDAKPQPVQRPQRVNGARHGLVGLE